mgnify:CR=1 FL=1
MDENNVQMGEFSAKDIAVAGYFSYMLGKNFVGGITAKFITSYIGDYNSIGMGVDLGINYYDPDHEWSISAVAKNLGGQLKAYDEEYDKMPIDLQMGVSKQFPNMPFRLSLTLVNLNNWDVNFKEHLVGGVEILLSNIWIGAGYNFRRASEMKIQSSNDSSSSHGAGLSLGAGLNLERFHLNQPDQPPQFSQSAPHRKRLPATNRWKPATNRDQPTAPNNQPQPTTPTILLLLLNYLITNYLWLFVSFEKFAVVGRLDGWTHFLASENFKTSF